MQSYIHAKRGSHFNARAWSSMASLFVYRGVRWSGGGTNIQAWSSPVIVKFVLAIKPIQPLPQQCKSSEAHFCSKTVRKAWGLSFGERLVAWLDDNRVVPTDGVWAVNHLGTQLGDGGFFFFLLPLLPLATVALQLHLTLFLPQLKLLPLYRPTVQVELKIGHLCWTQETAQKGFKHDRLLLHRPKRTHTN